MYDPVEENLKNAQIHHWMVIGKYTNPGSDLIFFSENKNKE
jgi:hypothetical protein